MSQITAKPGLHGEQLRAEADDLIQEHTPEGQILEHDLEVLEQPNIHPLPKVRHGLVVEEILEEAKEGNYDLVVIGAHRTKGWEGLLLDNIAQQIIVQIDRPILVIR